MHRTLGQGGRGLACPPRVSVGTWKLKLPTPDFDELESERFDLSKDSVECGLVREPAGEHRLAAILPG